MSYFTLGKFAALFQTDQLRGLGEKDRAAGAENYPAARFDPLQNGPHQRLPPADRYLPRHNLGFGGNPTKLWRSPQGSAGQVCSLPPFLPMFATRSQRSARDTQGCFAMTKDPTRPDDLELDDLLRRLHLFGQVPSREYIAAVFSGQSVTQTRNRSER